MDILTPIYIQGIFMIRKFNVILDQYRAIMEKSKTAFTPPNLSSYTIHISLPDAGMDVLY